MEQDIKILERMLNKESSIYKTNKRGNKEIKFEVNSKYYEALKRVIKEYKKLKEENEQLKLKERSRVLGRYGEIEVHDLINKTLANDYIPTSLVEEKIEELKRQRRELRLKTYLRREDMLNDDRAIACEIAVLQELLEKRK